MKRSLSLLLLPFVLLLAGCGASPSSVTKQFYMATSEGRVDDALALFDVAQAEANGVSRQKLRTAIAGRSEAINGKDCGGLSDVKIVNEDLRGEIANQTVELVCKSGATKKIDGRLMKGKDGWRMVVILR